MKPDYRNMARQSTKRAHQELETHDPHRLIYAALELRFSLEYLTYERAYAYREDIPPSEYKTWQPKKLMAVLLEIDPMADQSYSLSFAPEATLGVVAPGTNFHRLGDEHVVNLATLKNHYDALSSYLHAPTINKLETPNIHKEEKLRKRCDEIIEEVEKALSSQVWSTSMPLGGFSSIKCMRCEHPIRRRIPIDEKEIDAECFNCNATYLIVIEPDRTTTWKPKQWPLSCSNSECEQEITLWEDVIKAGAYWRCKSCGQESQICLGIKPRTEGLEQ